MIGLLWCLLLDVHVHCQEVETPSTHIEHAGMHHIILITTSVLYRIKPLNRCASMDYYYCSRLQLANEESILVSISLYHF